MEQDHSCRLNGLAVVVWSQGSAARVSGYLLPRPTILGERALLPLRACTMYSVYSERHFVSVMLLLLACAGASFVLRALIYKRILAQYKEAGQRTKSDAQEYAATPNFLVPKDAILKRMSLPRWLVLRALDWEDRRRRFENLL